MGRRSTSARQPCRGCTRRPLLIQLNALAGKTIDHSRRWLSHFWGQKGRMEDPRNQLNCLRFLLFQCVCYCACSWGGERSWGNLGRFGSRETEKWSSSNSHGNSGRTPTKHPHHQHGTALCVTLKRSEQTAK